VYATSRQGRVPQSPRRRCRPRLPQVPVRWAGVGRLLAIGVLTVVLLWLYYNLSFRFDPRQLLNE
jgi:hypothetical protein